MRAVVGIPEQELENPVLCLGRAFRGIQHLDPVAGGEEVVFLQTGKRTKGLQRIFIPVGQGQLFPDLQGGGLVVDAKKDDRITRHRYEFHRGKGSLPTT